MPKFTTIEDLIDEAQQSIVGSPPEHGRVELGTKTLDDRDYWENINLYQLIVFTLMGASGLLSHWCLAQAFKMSDTTFVMPLQFTKLIWASLIGLFIFAEQPDIWTWVGGVIIFISVVYITYREAFKKKGTQKPIQVDRAIIN